MSNDDMLRETMRRAVGDEPTAGDAFARFGLRRRRAARWRTLTSVGAGAAAVVALMWMLPGIGGEGVPGPGGSAGSASPEPRVYKRHVDRVAKFEIAYPYEWGRQGREGVFAVFFTSELSDPPETDVTYTGATCCDPPLIETPARFHVLVKVMDGIRADARIADIDKQEEAGARVERFRLSVDDQPTDARFIAYPTEEPPKDSGVRDWCARCSIKEYLVGWPGGAVLDVRFVAPDAKTMTALQGEVDYALKSLLYYGIKPK